VTRRIWGITLVLALEMLAGCGQEGSPSLERTDWLIAAADDYGAVITDGDETRGVTRDGSIAWTVNGPFRNVACVGHCPSSLVSFQDIDGSAQTKAFGAQADALMHSLRVPEDARVLAASTSSVAAISSASPRYLTIYAASGRRDVRINSNVGPWYGNSDNTAGVYVDSASRSGKVIYVLINKDGNWQVTAREEASSGFACAGGVDKFATSNGLTFDGRRHDISLPEDLGNCLMAKDGRLVGIKAYVQQQGGKGETIGEFRAFSSQGSLLWETSYGGYTYASLGAQSGDLLVIHSNQAEVIDIGDGSAKHVYQDVAFAAFSASGQVVTVDPFGQLKWA
jgi:hypothetical protein